ncbi:E3 ubiquitin-protein ligase (HECT-domain-containing protein) [Colletotrichum tofieldiae]|uniref:HECT-type E3 ubiquitin transferase n=1 Tax=Colletotrichum tofieldiae TaxID=708197 RepID=A0A161WPW4_9PEZI|nr:E3 ubiquitin-protein ligase (HECT-domain-containing protein) [Colletotrichum tofieldiae]GKT94262.1 E3 ubiquitin-protein ligase [Colletotrichum tofieldiae]
MFPTFTGNSRRPRNVNLSGQNLNPFAASSWTPAAGSGTSKTVSNAQAERAQRQQDRDRLKAAGKIQKTWRGHRIRRRLRDSRREAFDALYKSNSDLGTQQRLSTALPLLLTTFQSKHDKDLERLFRFCRELTTTNLECLAPERLAPPRLARFVRILVEALDVQTKKRQETDDTQLLVDLLTHIVNVAPESLSTSFRQYYTALAELCGMLGAATAALETTSRAVLVPLRATLANDYLSAAYEAFALSFLTRHDLRLIEEQAQTISQNLDSDNLATAITTAYSNGRIHGVGRDGQVWLLAHFIGLHQKTGTKYQGLKHLDALHIQLSSLSTEISLRLSVKATDSTSPNADSNTTEETLIRPLPGYVTQQLTSLVDRDGISALLAELTTHFGSQSSSHEFQTASLLSGYILTLLRCFPSQGDDIRMRLFLGDVRSSTGSLPTIKFLWQAMSQTSIYKQILQDSASVTGLLRNYLSKSSKSNDSQEPEWRLVLLFLELYIFILRLSDDEDFFSSVHPGIMQSEGQMSRLRSCGLSLSEVKNLTIVLKHLAFTLHYNAADILQGVQQSEPISMSQLESYFGSGNAAKSSKETRNQGSRANAADTRLDLGSLRSIVTTALRLLYERDSRRPFLPRDHWLMTSKFDMEGFVSAVVAEQERQNEVSDSSDEEDGEVDEDANLGGLHGGIIHTMAGQRVSRHAQIEKLRSQQRKAQRDRLLAVIGPKLEILRHMPFVIPFDTRVQIFRQFVYLDKHKRREGMDADQWRMAMLHNPLRSPGRSPAGRHHGKIRRGQVFQDAFEQFYELGEGLKEPIQIQFVDQFDTVEAGIDGGGVTKEFLTSVTTEAFGQMDGISLFTANSQGLLYPNPTAMDELKEALRRAGVPERTAEWQEQVQDLLRQFEFLGRIVGKCMYEGILVDIAFAGFFLLKWISGQTGENSYRGNVNDLRDLDEELYQGMLRLKNYNENVADLALDFTINDQVSLPGEPVRTITRNLIPNGENVTVTNDNRLLYISYIARHRLVAQPAQQTAAFLRGLRSIIAPSWLSMFNQNELQRLVGGDSSEIDIEDLRRNTIYSGLYEVGDDGLEHPTVQLFWKVMANFSDRERRDVLKYVTSTPRAPLLGFSQLSPRFSIRDGGEDQERLPSTSTCVNLLKLPRYKDQETLRKKLLYAVSSGAGFDLS